MHDPEGLSLRKMYFIRKGDEGEEILSLLKNKFKLIDAIRDIIGWHMEGRSFTVMVRDTELGEDDAEEHRFELSPVRVTMNGQDQIIELIACIISWLDAGRIYEIVLVPRSPDYHTELN